MSIVTGSMRFALSRAAHASPFSIARARLRNFADHDTSPDRARFVCDAWHLESHLRRGVLHHGRLGGVPLPSACLLGIRAVRGLSVDIAACVVGHVSVLLEAPGAADPRSCQHRLSCHEFHPLMCASMMLHMAGPPGQVLVARVCVYRSVERGSSACSRLWVLDMEPQDCTAHLHRDSSHGQAPLPPPTKPQVSWVGWHASSMRRSRYYVAVHGGSSAGPQDLEPVRHKVWLGWAQLAPETIVGRAIALHTSRSSADAVALYRGMHAHRHIESRNRCGRPPQRFEQVLVETCRPEWWAARGAHPSHLLAKVESSVQ